MKYIMLIISMLLGSGLSVFAQPKASFDKTMHEFVFSVIDRSLEICYTYVIITNNRNSININGAFRKICDSRTYIIYYMPLFAQCKIFLCGAG